jgi:cytochrome c oxidase subunit 1
MAYELVFREEGAEQGEPRRSLWDVIRHWTTTTNHKDIGILYIVTAFFFFLLGGILAMLMRVELSGAGPTIMDADTYNRIFSLHGTTMIFLFVIPVLVGFGNYLVPLLIGAEDMAYPRLNALGFWMILPAGLMMWLGAPAFGWTAYAPLSATLPGLDADLWVMGLLIIGASSTMGAVNFIVTIYKHRRPGVRFGNMSLFVWTVLVTAGLILLATPVLAAALVMILFDRNLGTTFFLAGSGDPILWQHLFWFYSHPAVYIMVLPAMGIISEVIPRFARRPIFGYRAIVYSTLAIGVLGFLVWAHHMFTVGLDFQTRVPFMLTTMAIAVPTGVKVFNWTATLFQGRISFTVPMLFAVGFLTMFVIGGISGVFQASIPLDYQLQDTYFVVAHLHYVLFGGSVLGIFAGLYYWYPSMTGRMYHRGLAKLHFWGTIVALNLVFFTFHYIGLAGMPRRIFDYTYLLSARPELEVLNQLATIGAILLGLFQIPFFYNMLISRYTGRPVAKGEDPWEPKPRPREVPEAPAAPAYASNPAPGDGNPGR